MRNLISLLCFSLISGLAYSQDLQTQIIGIWRIDAYDSENLITTFERGKKFKKNKRAYEFKDNGEVLVRINSFGCMVIGKNEKSYGFLSDLTGTWRLINEKQVEIYYETFITETFEIAELNEGKLVLKRK
jgi:hypothetical protein